MANFLKQVSEELACKRVLVTGLQTLHYQMARAGLDERLRNVFAPDSFIMSGGGTKGQVVPDDWAQQVLDFTGAKRVAQMYGMSEMLSANFLCENRQYHIQPWIILFVVDPDTGAPLPRTGVQTGRVGFYDLLTERRWGGFVSDDEVTADWTPCACGRTTPHIAENVQRYSLNRGGDDKISCVAQ